MSSLAKEQVEKYLDDGFLFPNKAMDVETAKTFRDRLESIEAKYASSGPGRDLNQYLRVNAHLVMPMAIELARNEAILDAIESIIGRDILVWSVPSIWHLPGWRCLLQPLLQGV